jgi:recombination protein RecA
MAAHEHAAAAAKGAKGTPSRKRAVIEESRARVRIESIPDDSEELGAASTYFADVSQKNGITFISAGAAIIDAMLGGGYACGRVVNIVGDKSAGKTLLAIEATANFHMTMPDGLKRYGESEHAFDVAYASALGMPVDAVEFIEKDTPFRTVQDFERDLKRFCKKVREQKRPGGLYVLDSLDALSDEAELARQDKKDKAAERAVRARDDDDDAPQKVAGTFGADKAKMMSEMFRLLVADLEEANVLLIVVSQLRDKIGAMFGERQTRSGGRALDFYATHIIWLREKAKIKQTMNGIERIIGVDVVARVKKNKVGLPFRQCEYPILFGYGVDDLTANVEWLFEVKRDKLLEEEFGMSKSGYKVRIANMRNKGGDVVRDMRARLREAVLREWQVIEQGFLPKARKY